MLKINKNALNALYVTVTENTTISDAKYLMQLFSNDNHTDKVVRFTGDTSNNPARWNIFYLREDSSEDLENAVISLDAGTYDYSIYETSGTTGTTITGLTRVESGLLEVDGTGTTRTTFNDENGIITFDG
jgi:hypothetical protein